MFAFTRRFLSTSASIAKTNSVNSISLVGVVHQIDAGYVGSDLTLQFMLVCNYLPIANETPVIHPLSNSENNNNNNRSATPVEREYFTIRATGYLDELKAQLHEGAVVSVQGQFKMNVQPEPLADHKPMPFPYVAVKLSSSSSPEGKSTEKKKSSSSTDFVEILHSGKSLAKK